MEGLFWVKPVELDTGVIVSFWILQTITVNALVGTAEVSYLGYLDQAAFNAGKQKILEMSKTISFVGFDTDGALSSRIISMVSND